MIQKHTPTPWNYHSGMIWKQDGSENGIPIARMDRDTGNGTTPTERDVNAVFIVEACNAYDGLVDYVRTLEQFLENANICNYCGFEDYGNPECSPCKNVLLDKEADARLDRKEE